MRSRSNGLSVVTIVTLCNIHQLWMLWMWGFFFFTWASRSLPLVFCCSACNSWCCCLAFSSWCCKSVFLLEISFNWKHKTPDVLWVYSPVLSFFFKSLHCSSSAHVQYITCLYAFLTTNIHRYNTCVTIIPGQMLSPFHHIKVSPIYQPVLQCGTVWAAGQRLAVLDLSVYPQTAAFVLSDDLGPHPAASLPPAV